MYHIILLPYYSQAVPEHKAVEPQVHSGGVWSDVHHQLHRDSEGTGGPAPQCHRGVREERAGGRQSATHPGDQVCLRACVRAHTRVCVCVCV